MFFFDVVFGRFRSFKVLDWWLGNLLWICMWLFFFVGCRLLMRI